MKSFKNANRRSFMKASSIALMLGLTGWSNLASARTLAEIIASKKLVVGVNPTLPPLGVFNAKNEIDGVDVDIARAMAAKMGLALEIVQVGSPDRIPFVNSGKIDMVMGAMTWTPERAKVIDYTIPVYTEVMGVLTTQKMGWKDWKELDDPKVRLVQVRGTTPVKFISEKLPKAQVLLLDNYPDAVRAIAQDRADGMVDVHEDAQGDMEDRPDARRYLFLRYRRRQGQRSAARKAQQRYQGAQRERRDRQGLGEVVRRADAARPQGGPALERSGLTLFLSKR